MLPQTRVSSSWTIFYKIFIPTVWIVFFGSITVFAAIMGALGRMPVSVPLILGLVVFLAVGIVLLAISVMRLKRVEMGEDAFFVTNYFKTFRYSYKSLRDIEEIDLLIMKLAVFKFVEKTSFGKKIYFIERRKVWSDFVGAHPHLFAHLA